MRVLPPAEMYRELARQLRSTARTKSDRYTQRELNRTAERYDEFADQIERNDGTSRATMPPLEDADE